MRIISHLCMSVWVCFMLFHPLVASADKIGTWHTYSSYNGITEIEPAGKYAFVLASNALFSYHTEDGALETYSKANVLSDNGIAHIAWNKSAKKLVIAYQDGNIDLLTTGGEVTNVSDLYLKSMTEDKNINHIYISGNNAYLSTSFGILKLNVKDGNVQDTYQLGFEVNYSYLQDNYLYAASKTKGLYRGALTDNLLDKANWVRVGAYQGLIENRTNVYDSTTKYWWTTTDEGKLTYYTVDADNERTYKTEGILPDGPASNHFYRLYMHQGKLYAVGGIYSQEKDGSYPGEVHVWDGNAWSEFEQPTNQVLGHRNVDWLCMDFDPLKEGHVMVGAKSGLYEFQDGKFVKCYNSQNSPLASCINNDNYTLTTSVKYDASGKLWVLNSVADKDLAYPIRVFSQSENKWEAFYHDEMSKNHAYANAIDLMISTHNGKMWFVNNWYESTRLYAYDYVNDALVSFGPDYVNEDGTTQTPQHAYCVAEDKDGNIWLGTTAGPLYITPADMQQGTSIFTQHKVPRNDGTNYADYLLANIVVRSIAVDGANRKWIGTSNNGVFLISSDCNTQIRHFTSENSPLVSDIIHDIFIDSSMGTVYFATDKGLCSYVSDATEPSEEMTKDNVYAYPNPVTPDYTGDITIVGLSYDADVKIVSVNGTLVNQGRSTGGSYTWNGRDLKGRKVASGVYMVETAMQDGSKGTVCKIAVIK